MIYWRTVDRALLEPGFVADLESVLAFDPATWYVTWGFRDPVEQDRLWRAYQAGGPKAASPGKSPHEFGLAVDLALDGDPHTPRLQPEWNETHPDWIRLRALIDAHPRLHGGWWFADGDHIERTKWKQYAGWRAAPAGPVLA